MIGTNVTVQHISDGKGGLMRTNRQSVETVVAVYTHKDDHGNMVVQLSNGEPFSIKQTDKGWTTV